MNPFENTPFAATPDATDPAFLLPIKEVEEKLALLRTAGKLTPATLRDYYGETRFEQVAESNAIEGSPLDVGETRLAVLKGMTSLVHDERYVQDAKALHDALVELERLGQTQKPVDLTEVHRLHELALAGRQGTGVFRHDPVTITGSRHKPPAEWKEVMDGMEAWERWSINHPNFPPLLRATILHAWFVFVHPYVDGNGRTARAISNLELIRHGHPPVLIRRKQDRDRYIDALERADFGDLRPFLDLMTDRGFDAVRDLERSAIRRQGYSPLVQKERNAFQNRLGVWNVAVTFLYESLVAALRDRLEGSAVEMSARRHADLTLDDFIDLSKGERVSTSWAFSLAFFRNGQRVLEYLLWTDEIGDTLAREFGPNADRPSLRWSLPGGQGMRIWRSAKADESPYAIRLTFHRDSWVVLCRDGTHKHEPSELAAIIADKIIDRLVPSASL